MGEVLQRENRHSYKADIWSLGILALELTFGKPPHSKSRPVKVMLTILQSPPPTIESMEKDREKDKEKEKAKYSKKFKDFLSKCLQKDANKRLSAAQLLGHSWMKSAKNEDYVRQHILAQYTPNMRQQIRNDLMPYSVQQRLKKMKKQKEQQQKVPSSNPMLKAASSATMDSIRVESNGFDFSSAIHSVSQSGHHHSPLSPDTEQTEQTEQTTSEEKGQNEETKENEEAAKQLGRFDVTVQNKQNAKAPQPTQTTDEQTKSKATANDDSTSQTKGDGNDSNVSSTKGRFKKKKIT